jgi:hypothetical protein
MESKNINQFPIRDYLAGSCIYPAKDNNYYGMYHSPFREGTNKLRMNINGMNILEWFKQRFEELQKSMGNRNKQAKSNIKQIKL